jgi:hypothetical protein
VHHVPEAFGHPGGSKPRTTVRTEGGGGGGVAQRVAQRWLSFSEFAASAMLWRCDACRCRPVGPTVDLRRGGARTGTRFDLSIGRTPSRGAPRTQVVTGVSQHAREATASARGRASRYQARLSASRRPGTNPSARAARASTRVGWLVSREGSLYAASASRRIQRPGAFAARTGRARKPDARAHQSPRSPSPTSHPRMAN